MHKHDITTNPACGLCYCDVHEGCVDVQIISRNGFAAVWCGDCRVVVDLEAAAHRISVDASRSKAVPE